MLGFAEHEGHAELPQETGGGTKSQGISIAHAACAGGFCWAGFVALLLPQVERAWGCDGDGAGQVQPTGPTNLIHRLHYLEPWREQASRACELSEYAHSFSQQRVAGYSPDHPTCATTTVDPFGCFLVVFSVVLGFVAVVRAGVMCGAFGAFTTADR